MPLLIPCFYALLFLPLNASSHELFHANIAPPLKEKITWIVEDTQEWQSYIDKTPTSTSNETAIIIINGLVDLGYRLDFIKATGDRAEKILRDEDNACIADRIKTPAREIFSVFSQPHDLYLGQKLYRIAQSSPLNQNDLNTQGELISLERLFSNYPTQILGVASGVSYGVYLDKDIAKLAPKNIFVRSGSKRISSLAKMLFKQRVNYVIYYPQEINELNLANLKLESYKIAGSPPYFLGHVACSKTEQGYTITGHINEILKQAYRTRQFYCAHEKWLDTVDLPIFRQYFHEVFNYLPEKTQSKL
jgi:uncharacterized protein (TIGR02285 family)